MTAFPTTGQFQGRNFLLKSWRDQYESLFFEVTAHLHYRVSDAICLKATEKEKFENEAQH